MNKIKNQRTEVERRLETLNMLYRLKESGYSGNFDAIRGLVEKLNEYVINGKDTEINIPFPEKNKRIIGKLFINKKYESMVKVTNL